MKVKQIKRSPGLQRAYDRGRAHGLTLSEDTNCPYKLSSPLRVHWFGGFDDGYQEALSKQSKKEH